MTMSRVLKHLKYPLLYPGLIPRAVDNYLRMFVLGRPRLRGIEFAITYACQCRCRHCSADFLKRPDRPTLTTAQIETALEQMWRLGAMNINLTGGEALLHPDLPALIRAAHPRSTVVSVATNGIGLDDNAARMLKREGARIVTISLDSADPATHDRSRGYEGCHDAVMAATEHCRRHGIEVFWCTIMTHENVADGDLLRMVELAERRGVMLTINFPCPVGKWWDKNLTPTAEEKSLHRRLMHSRHVRWEGHSNYRREGCPAGLEKLYISPYGDVMPCPFIHISYGNLTERPLRNIWRTLLKVGPFNKIHDGCPVSEDEQFARRYIAPLYQQETHPLPHEKHPAYWEKKS